MILSCSDSRCEGVASQMECWQRYGSVSNDTHVVCIRVAQWLVGSMAKHQ